MIVAPYVRNPPRPEIALLLPDATIVHEHGDTVHERDDWPPNLRLWASYETVYQLVREGRGEALCWRNEEIRWRRERPAGDEGWRARASDANVIKLPFSTLPVEAQLGGFAAWRDWLCSYGAAPTGTSGSAAWSLLRATVERKLVTNSGERPPIGFTVGGRQELGPGGQGHYPGPLTHLDLPAAYASTMARLRYGGVWLQTDERVTGRQLNRFTGGDHPVFVRARVRVPESRYGPLVRRPRRAPRSYFESVSLGSWYPTSTRLQGVWTFEELVAAEQHGARVERILAGWVHRSGWYPFAPWWSAVEQGREQGGLAGALAKMTGNALWGRFCLDTLGGRRTVRSIERGKVVSRALPARPAPFPAHDLAETVSGRVRARLFSMMMTAGPDLVSAHTDGAWLAGADREIVGWRVKEQARQLDLLDPQRLRYLPKGKRSWQYTVAGVPAELAPEFFERKWEEARL